MLPAFLADMVERLIRLLDLIIKVCDHNSVEFYSQDDQPTLADGELAVWKDTDAASTFPTHYLVYNDGTDTVTFASDQVVP